ncbi:reverse transcriptase-like protein [Candidatus Bipolaricaulota bacterium]|nr:reverse transcriptase-like protein [Candidatus Bipolaricaulota bacterium]HHR86041.1 reverse transcriptase-like protein [Candidatus Acetothermia bacterium]
MDKLFVYTDAHAQGDPGEAGIGIAITDKDGNVVEEIARLIGRATSQIARYRALIEAGRAALAYSPQSVIFFSDDQHLVNHLNGVFATREPHVKHLLGIARGVLDNFPQWRVNFIDHNVNRQASRLVEQAFHDHSHARLTREHLELRLLARVGTLDDARLEELIEFAERLEKRD